jgi:hypothetical protein
MDIAQAKAAFGNGKTTPASGNKSGIPKLRPPGEANKPPPNMPGDPDDDLANGMDMDMLGDGGAGPPLDFDQLEKDWPEVGEALEDVQRAHESGDKGELEEAVSRLCDVLAGHGIGAHLDEEADEGEEDASDAEDSEDGGEDQDEPANDSEDDDGDSDEPANDSEDDDGDSDEDDE